MHLRRIREDRGMTLEELAAHSGLSFRGVVYIEHGQRNPTLINLAGGLHVQPSRLLAVFDVEQGTFPEAGSPAQD
ncbi:helix-turn-helix domain-containing protein [Streptomyces sp. NPDC001351]|uniref:helix-turn-helix domain-containing protein n=1 Tax=Streptomyces sp. NPDC001351 TaxID=3364564 RepID=UPI0036C025E9